MNWKMAENSIFAILLRSPWWASALIAVSIIMLASVLLPMQYRVFGWTAALPFVVIMGMVLWRLSQAPSRQQIERMLERVRAMNAREFTSELRQGYERMGCQVEAVARPPADLLVTQGWRTRLVSCRRWKAAALGVEPLRELSVAREAAQAHDGVIVALGDVSPAALRFAKANRIEVLDADGLARLLTPGRRV